MKENLNMRMSFLLALVLIPITAVTADAAEPAEPAKPNELPLLVKFEDKCGFINSSGKFVIEAVYDQASKFSRPGLAWVSKGIRSEFIDVTGRASLPLPDGSKSQGFRGEEIVDIEFNHTERGHSVTTIDYEGKARSRTKATMRVNGYQYTPFSSAYTFFRKHPDNLGIVDRNGKWIIKPFYKKFSRFDGHSLFVKDSNEDWYKVSKGKVLQKLDFGQKKARHFEPVGKAGFAIARISVEKYRSKYGVVDDSGNWIVDPEFDDLEYSKQADKIFARKGKAYGFLDLQGSFSPNNLANSFKYRWFFGGKLIGKKQGELWGFVDQADKWIINPKYQAIDYCDLPISPPSSIYMPYIPGQTLDY